MSKRQSGNKPVAQMMSWDRYGMPIVSEILESGDLLEMKAPVQCKWCNVIHDSATVEVVQRYADCSVWKCPDCGVQIDDRPEALGGTALPLEPNR